MKVKKIYFFIWIIIASLLLYMYPITDDDFYLFSFGQNIKNGLIPYLDYNMLVTPLCAYIIAFFTLFLDNILVIKILWILCTVIICIYIDKILKKFIDGDFIVFLISATISLTMSLFSNFTYNLILVAWALFIYDYIINLEVENISFKNILFLSTFLFLGILLKQTLGLILFATAMFSLFIIAIKEKKYKYYFCKILIITFITFIYCLLFFVLLYFMGNLNEFIEQTILGVSSFNSDGVIESIMFIYVFLVINVVILIYTFWHKKCNLNYFILIIFSLTQLMGLYPLPNLSHLIFSLFFSVVVWVIFLKDILGKYFNYFVKIAVLVCGIFLIAETYNIYTDTEIVMSSQKYFVGGLISKEKEDNINLLNDYIENNKENKYYMITENSMMVNMNRDVYYKYYDLFFDGNLGRNNPVELIKKIENDYIIIYTDPTKDFWQIPVDALEYIRTLQKVDEIGPYSIYTNKFKTGN